MLGAFMRAFRTPDLRRKLLFSLAIMAIFRFGSFVPAPNVNYTNVQACIGGTSSGNDVLGLVNLFSGGALLQLSIFALGIMPYITASIIVQLLRVVIPRFEELHKEGSSGQSKLTQYTRYITIFLAVLQATVIITMARTGQLFVGCNLDILASESVIDMLIMIIAFTAGTTLVMWLGERITEKGVGNGMSLLIFTSIVSSFPALINTIRSTSAGFRNLVLFIVMCLIILTVIVFVEQSQRRIPVQYAKRMVGRRQYGGSTTYIPIKINMAGVIPVIFASSILALPGLASQFADDPNSGWALWVQTNLVDPSASLHIVFYIAMILFFAFFYTSITFNPDEVADNMKRYGGFIPGIRAGRPTAEYLQFVITRITSAGAIYLALVALVPTLVFLAMNVQNQLMFGGTSLLIMVSVGLDTVKQINAQLEQRHYEGFLR